MIIIKNSITTLYSFISNKFYFKIIYLFVSLSISTLLLFIPGIRFINQILIIYGIVLIGINIIESLINKRRLYSFKIVLYSFLVLSLILIISKYPSVENIKIWLINTIIFTVIFSIDTFKHEHKLKNELNIISSFFVLATFLFSFISAIMIISKSKFWLSETYKNEWISYGFSSFFSNENSLGIACAISFAISLYLFFNSKLISSKFFYSLNCLLQLVTMVLSTCRSAYLIIISLLFVYAFVYIKNNYFRIALTFIPLSGFLSVLLLLPNKFGMFLSGREDYWKSAFTLIKSVPLTGVGNTNLVPMITDFNPTFPLALKSGGLHNIYLQIATVNGLICLILILLFIIFIFLFMVKSLDNCNNNEKLKYTALLGLIIGIALINLLESNLVYIISFINLIFWIYSGYLVSIFYKKKSTS